MRHHNAAAFDSPPMAPLSQAPAGPVASGGWLSEVLTHPTREGEELTRGEDRATSTPVRKGPGLSERASRIEERNLRQTIISLDALSADIPQFVDHDAVADLWERHNRGERSDLTRRLYTSQGQKAFDEVRKRYKTDREFRQTVDRYIGEFERLLKEATHDDRNQTESRTYLTSDAGKVYTMLAHAAGRFD